MRSKKLLAGLLAFATAFGVIASPTVRDLPQLSAAAETAEISSDPVDINDCEIMFYGTPYFYTGSEIKPSVYIIDSTTYKELVEGVDYTVECEDNIEVGTASVTITGIGDYGDVYCEEFEIVEKSMSSVGVLLRGSTFYEGGEEIKPEVIVYYYETYVDRDEQYVEWRAVYLSEGKDYTVEYSNNREIGTATVTITGGEDFPGTVTKDFTIKKKDIEDDCYTGIYPMVFRYTGEEIKPNIHSYDYRIEKTLVEGVDYTAEYKDNTELGTGTVIITGIGDYSGSCEYPFRIIDSSIENFELAVFSPNYYTGKALEPEVKVYYEDAWFNEKLETLDQKTVYLVKDKDYTVSYENNTEAGTATVTVKGIGDYTGELTEDFEISKISIADAYIDLYGDPFFYTGSEIKPGVLVRRNGDYKALVEGVDYTVSYSDNKEVGKGTVTVTGIGGCEGTKSVSFDIAEKSVDNCRINIGRAFYTGEAVEPYMEVFYYTNDRNGNSILTNRVTLVRDVDYTLSFKNNIECGNASVTITGIGQFGGEAIRYFNIGLPDVENDCEYDIYGKIFFATGSEVRPVITLYNYYTDEELVEGVDYTLEYADNVEPGFAKIIVTGIGRYVGTKTIGFRIVEKNVENLSVYYDETAFYTGQPVKPYVALYYSYYEYDEFTERWLDKDYDLIEGRDYTLTCTNNTEIGTASAVITGIGDFGGSIPFEFEIKKPDIYEDCRIKVYSAPFFYTGSEIIPVVRVFNAETEEVLTEGVDYTVEFFDNTEIGEARVKVTGIGNYEGEDYATFDIIEKSVENCTVHIKDNAIYTGSPVKPTIEVYYRKYIDADEEDDSGRTYNYIYLTEGVDYTASYTDNINIGTAAVTITGIGEFTGVRTKDFTVREASIMNDCQVEFSEDPIFCTGSPITPAVIVKDTWTGEVLTEGVDYTLKFSDNINAGRASVTITGISRYKGTTVRRFTIYEKSVEMCDVSFDGYMTYTGSEVRPDVKVGYERREIDAKTGKKTTTYITLREGVDYTVTCSDNKEPGRAKLIISGIGEYTGTVKAYFYICKPIECETAEQLQSAHPYGNNEAAVYTYKVPGAKSLTVTFSDDTFTEYEYDCILIYTDEKNYKDYNYNFLSGKTVTVKGDTLKMIFVSDMTSTYYGFRVTSIVPEFEDVPETVSEVTGLKLKGRAADALRIAWDKNPDADGYIVEMYKDGKWVRAAKITSNDTTEFKKSGLEAGTAYKFRVKAYKMSGKTALYSEYVNIAARTNPTKISGLKLKGRAGNALRIAWDKNTSADGYIVEMYKDGKWVRAAKITSNDTTEFKKSGLAAGTAYKFRVKAYKMSGKTALYSSYVTVSARTNPSKVTGVKTLGRARTAVRFGWTKNTSADGYIVEMYKGGKWVRAAKITSNATVQFKKTGLKNGTAYKFRVKAYKMSGKTALYSGYTGISIATAK